MGWVVWCAVRTLPQSGVGDWSGWVVRLRGTRWCVTGVHWGGAWCDWGGVRCGADLAPIDLERLRLGAKGPLRRRWELWAPEDVARPQLYLECATGPGEVVDACWERAHLCRRVYKACCKDAAAGGARGGSQRTRTQVEVQIFYQTYTFAFSGPPLFLWCQRTRLPPTTVGEVGWGSATSREWCSLLLSGSPSMPSCCSHSLRVTQ